MCTNFVRRVIVHKEMFWNIDFITDKLLDKEAGHVWKIGIGDTSLDSN